MIDDVRRVWLLIHDRANQYHASQEMRAQIGFWLGGVWFGGGFSPYCLPNNHTPLKPNQAAPIPRMRPRIAL